MRQPHPAGLTAAVVSPLFGWVAILLLFVIPLLTMRLISEERRNKTLSLLLSAPLTMTEIVLGKFFGIVTYLLIMIAMLTLMPMSLLLGGTLDFGLMFMSAFGLILLLASFAAIGLFMSTLTQSPTLAAISTFGALFFYGFCNWGQSWQTMVYWSISQSSAITCLSWKGFLTPLTLPIIFWLLSCFSC